MKTLTALMIFAVAMLLSTSLFAGDIDTMINNAPPSMGGRGHYALRMGYISMALFGCFWAAFILFNVFKWSFVEKALSETKDGVTSPSGFRLISYLGTVGLLYAFIYHTVRKQVLDTTQFGYLLVFISVVLGAVKSTEITAIIRGGNSQPQQPAKPENQQ